VVISEKDVSEIEEIAHLLRAQGKELNAIFLLEVKDKIISHDILIRAKIAEYKFAKQDHKKKGQCSTHGCTECHFWSGSIAALSELIGDAGVIE
jgi:hypothetical protein